MKAANSSGVLDVAARMRSSFFMRSSSLTISRSGQAYGRHVRPDDQLRAVNAALRAD